MHQSQGGPYPYNNGCTISALSSHYPSAASRPCITLKLVWHHNMYLCVGAGELCVHARQAWQMAQCKMYDMRLRERQREAHIGKWRSMRGREMVCVPQMYSLMRLMWQQHSVCSNLL